jgi:hypothetical protein
MVSSGVWAGEIPLERAHNLQEVGGGPATMKQELERIGYLGDMEASYEAMPIAVGYGSQLCHFIELTIQAHFELHIGESSTKAVSLVGSRPSTIGIAEDINCCEVPTAHKLQC